MTRVLSHRLPDQRAAATILGPHFERLCREWVLHFAADRFGGVPALVSAGTVHDPANKGSHQVDVVVVGHSDGGKPPLIALGEAKWNDVMGLGHLERLRRIRSLAENNAKFDTRQTRLACFSAAGFTSDLRRDAAGGDVELIGLDDLYGSA
jgi:uncharacterized protein